jgi:hypothetical protein
MRFASLPRVLIVACAVAMTVAAFAPAVTADDRTSRRAAELALPDPYLDPSWPDEAGEEMDGRYAPGKSDSVEEVPLGDELEMQEELRALQELRDETPPSAAATAPVPAAEVAVPGAAAEGMGVVEPAPSKPEPYVPQENDEDPDLDQRDPQEW